MSASLPLPALAGNPLLSPAAVAVALDLLSHRTWWSSEPQAVMAQRLGYATLTIRRALQRLEALRVLVRQHQPLWAGGRRADLIRVCKPKLVHLLQKAARLAERNRDRAGRCSFRTTFPGSKQIPLTSNEVRGRRRTLRAMGEDAVMDQGSLFGRVSRSRPAPSSADTAFARYRTWQACYRRKYGAPPSEANRTVTLSRIKAWQVHLPTPAHWEAFCEEWLAITIPAVCQARHPLLWVTKHFHYLVPKADQRVHAQGRQALEAQWDRDAQQRQAEAAARNPEEDRAQLRAMREQAEAARRQREAALAEEPEVPVMSSEEMDRLLREANHFLFTGEWGS